MKTFRIEETFTGYAEITIEAETELQFMVTKKKSQKQWTSLNQKTQFLVK